MKVVISFDTKKLKIEGNLNLAVVSDILATIKNQNHNIIDTWTLDQEALLEEIGEQKQKEHVENEQEEEDVFDTKEDKYLILPNYDIGACKYELVRNDGIIIESGMFSDHYSALNEWELNYAIEDVSNETASKWEKLVRRTEQPTF